VKRSFLILTVLMFLAGCGAIADLPLAARNCSLYRQTEDSHQQMLEKKEHGSPVEQSAMREYHAWEKTFEMTSQTCETSRELPRAGAAAYMQCWESLVAQNIRPVTRAPDKLDAYIRSMRENADAYAHGAADWCGHGRPDRLYWCPGTWDTTFREYFNAAYPRQYDPIYRKSSCWFID
jgi:hypothetical protein